MLTSTGIQNSKTRPPQIELCRTGMSNLSNICTCGISTGTPSNCGTSVVCTVTTRHQSLNNNGSQQVVKELYLRELDGLLNSRAVGTMPPKDSREVQHTVDELIDDRERRGQGRRSIFPNRLSTARLRLPRQPATAVWRHDARVLGSLPYGQWGLWAPALFRMLQSTLGREHLLFLAVYESAPCVTWPVFGSPLLRTVCHCTGQVATDPQSPEGGSQRACPTRGAHPTASGRREQWR